MSSWDRRLRRPADLIFKRAAAEDRRRSEKPPVYVLCPGWVISTFDGDRYYVSAEALARCYRLDIRDCKILQPESLFRPKPDVRYIYLHPRDDGNYKLEGL